MLKAKLSPAQERTYNEIINAPHLTPDEAYGTFYLEEDYASSYALSDGTEITHRWKGGLVYSVNFLDATLRVLERKGLIRVYEYGGAFNAGRGNTSIIEIL